MLHGVLDLFPDGELKRCLVAFNWTQDVKNYKEFLMDPENKTN